MPHAGLTLKL